MKKCWVLFLLFIVGVSGNPLLTACRNRHINHKAFFKKNKKRLETSMDAESPPIQEIPVAVDNSQAKGLDAPEPLIDAKDFDVNSLARGLENSPDASYSPETDQDASKDSAGVFPDLDEPQVTDNNQPLAMSFNKEDGSAEYQPGVFPLQETREQEAVQAPSKETESVFPVDVALLPQEENNTPTSDQQKNVSGSDVDAPTKKVVDEDYPTENEYDQSYYSQDDGNSQESDEDYEHMDDAQAADSLDQQELPSKTGASFSAESDFNIEAKRRAAQRLVEKGVAYLKRHTEEESFSAFSHDSNFRVGELYLFAYSSKGVCLAHGNQPDLIWDDMLESKDTYGVPFVQLIIERGRTGGDWVTYQWDNATKVSYVKEVRKNGKSYYLGAGYYPHSKVDAVVNLVKGAVAYFNSFIKEGKSKADAFSSFSYTLGQFIFGDLYLYAVSFKGIQYAHGETPGFVGADVWNYRDSTGKLVNQEIVSLLKDVDYGTGIWIDYESKNASKRTYAEKIIDGEGQQYFVACGYYPEANRTEAQNLVKRGFRYMKSNGKSEAARMFTDVGEKEFRYGDLSLFVNTTKGVCIANGSNTTVVGNNQFEERDENGDYYIQHMINKARAGGGWVDYKTKNSFKSVYVEGIDLGTDQYIIGSGVFPITKYENMVLMAKSGADYFASHTREEALREFCKKSGRFIRGDLFIFVFDSQGICLASGDNYDLIWKNLIKNTDEGGKPFVRLLINTAKKGSGDLTYQHRNATRVVHVESVEKDGATYIVGSGFYL